MKQLSLDEITRLNGLLDDSLHQASKQQLATCIKLLGTSLAHLKIKFNVDDNENTKDFAVFVQDLEKQLSDNTSTPDEFNKIASKTIVECATAMAVAKENLNKTMDDN